MDEGRGGHLDWETHWLGDVGYFVRCRPETVGRCIGMKFESFEGVGWSHPAAPAGWPHVVAYTLWIENYKGSGDETTVEELNNAHRAVYGTVRWDSTGHIYFGEPRDEGYVYCGDLRDATRIGVLLGHIWRIAWEFYLKESSVPADPEDF